MRRVLGVCLLSGLSWSAFAASNVSHSAITVKPAATTQLAREKEPGDDRGGKKRGEPQPGDDKGGHKRPYYAREKEPGDDRGGKDDRGGNNEKIHHHRGRNGDRRS